jgi:hypothetical protein
MNVPAIRNHLETVIGLARLLEQVEAGAVRIDADGYRELVLQLKGALAEELPQRALQAILNTYSATSVLYENLHYPHSGLSRAPLERSAASEVQTRQILARMAARPRAS